MYSSMYKPSAASANTYLRALSHLRIPFEFEQLQLAASPDALFHFRNPFEVESNWSLRIRVNPLFLFKSLGNSSYARGFTASESRLSLFWLSIRVPPNKGRLVSCQPYSVKHPWIHPFSHQCSVYYAPRIGSTAHQTAPTNAIIPIIGGCSKTLFFLKGPCAGRHAAVKEEATLLQLQFA